MSPIARLLILVAIGLAAVPSPGLAQVAGARSQSDVDRRPDEHRDHVGLAEGTARRGRRRGGLRDHPRRHPPLRHDHDSRPAAAGAGRRCRADQREQMGGVGARLQRPVREQAARADRRPQRLQPDLFGRALGRRGPDARRHRSDRSDSRPGAAIWGANAVNGVINIVTKAAADTQGGLVRVDGGRAGSRAPSATAGRSARRSYRLFSQWTGRDESLIAPGTRADDRVAQCHDRIPRRLDGAARRVHAGRRLHGRAGARALAESQSADRRARADRRRAVRCPGWPSPRPLDAHRRRRRLAPDPVVRRHREPAGAARRLSPACLRPRHAIPHGRSARVTTSSPAPATGSSASASTATSASR